MALKKQKERGERVDRKAEDGVCNIRNKINRTVYHGKVRNMVSILA
jgi:hypothetical protein